MFSGLLEDLQRDQKYKYERKDKVYEARQLMEEDKFDEALKVLENVNHSSDEKSVANIVVIFLKAGCYAELGNTQNAQKCIDILLSMSRLSINPFYQITLSRMKKWAKELKKEYNL